MFVKHPSRKTSNQQLNMSLEVPGEVWAADRNFRVVSLWLILKIMILNKISEV